MVTENVASFPLCACLNALSVVFAVLDSDWYMSAAAAQAPESAIDTMRHGIIWFMTDMLSQHPKASNTGQTSSYLQQAAGRFNKEPSQGLAAMSSLLHSLLSNIQQQPGLGASLFQCRGGNAQPYTVEV